MNEDLETLWHARFDNAASHYEDDHALAFWSREGLEAREKLFFNVFQKAVHSSQRILDLGCGPGIYARTLTAGGHHVFGLDYTVSVLHKAKAKAQAAGHPFSLTGGNVYHLPYRDAVFDSVVCIGVFQLLSDEERALQEIGRVLKPGGLLFLITRNTLFVPNRRTDRGGCMRSFNPFTLRRYVVQNGYTEEKLDGVFVLRGRLRFLRPFLNRLHRINISTLPLILIAEAFLLMAKKKP